jgi:hypothetical protein
MQYLFFQTKKQLKFQQCVVDNKEDFVWCCRLHWEPIQDFPWNKINAQMLEDFGLPGDRYITKIGLLNTVFFFKSPQDLVLFKLKWSEYEL